MEANCSATGLSSSPSIVIQIKKPPMHSPGRYVSIIQSNIESGPKMIQFNIQFKTKFEIFIQSKIHSKISLKYSIQNFIQEIGKK